MSNTELPEKYDPKTLIGKVLVDLKEIELPEMVEHNLIRSACRLITGVVNIPTAWFKSIERNISRETEALDLISKSNAKDIIELNSKDVEFIQNTSNYYTLRQLKETSNRRKPLKLTVNELKDSSVSPNCEQEIDEDWLDLFTRTAETKSNEDIQLILSKILAGEIRKPGSFSPSTIQTLSLLTQETAQAFLKLCGCQYQMDIEKRISNVIMLDQPFLNTHWTINEKKSSSKYFIRKLQNIGLVRTDLISISFAQISFCVTPIGIGMESLLFKEVSHTKQCKTDLLTFTDAGNELKTLLEVKTDKEYVDKAIEWIEKEFKLKLIERKSLLHTPLT